MIPTALISTRHEYWSLAAIYGPIAIVVLLLVSGVFIWAVLRYRRQATPATWSEHNPLEVSYAAFLTLVVVFLLYVTFSHEHRVDTVANRQTPDLTVDVTAGRWEWSFAYPRYGIVAHSGVVGDQALVVPTNRAIRFNLTSIDVIHAFWVPELEFKHDMFPGKVQYQILTFTRPGLFQGQCAVFCGLRHPEMIFRVQAMSPAAFAAWLQARTGGRAT